MIRWQTVLIPLNSGLVFTWRCNFRRQKIVCLNPFEFRAGIYFKYYAHLTKHLGLNPFEFRAGIYFRSKCASGRTKGVLIPLNSGLVFTWRIFTSFAVPLRLNPFEFRAGIYLTTSRLPRQCAGLNPFEFRAGIYLKPDGRLIQSVKS